MSNNYRSYCYLMLYDPTELNGSVEYETVFRDRDRLMQENHFSSNQEGYFSPDTFISDQSLRVQSEIEMDL